MIVIGMLRYFCTQTYVQKHIISYNWLHANIDGCRRIRLGKYGGWCGVIKRMSKVKGFGARKAEQAPGLCK